MGHHFRKNMLLAGVSALAIMLGAAAARPETFDFTGVEVTWTVPVTGLYDLTAFGAHGGGAAGGKGAEIGGDIELSSGTVLSIVVGGEGKSGGSAFGAGGGGGSFVFEGSTLLVAAGGGGGHGYYSTPGGPGLTTASGGMGSQHPGDPFYATLGPGYHGGQGGTGGQGGGVGPAPQSQFNGGGGGAGVHGGGASTTPGAFGGDGAPGIRSFGGSGDGAGLNGGFGGGGGGGFDGGGGGGGYSGGGGGQGYSEHQNSGGGRGGSFLASAFTDPLMVAGENIGDGSVTIDLISSPPPTAPEPSTWAMALAGFGGLGWLARLRARKSKPA
jgi:hypothetical protein